MLLIFNIFTRAMLSLYHIILKRQELLRSIVDVATKLKISEITIHQVKGTINDIKHIVF
jgi:hypothetical protein